MGEAAQQPFDKSVPPQKPTASRRYLIEVTAVWAWLLLAFGLSILLLSLWWLREWATAFNWGNN